MPVNELRDAVASELAHATDMVAFTTEVAGEAANRSRAVNFARGRRDALAWVLAVLDGDTEVLR